ncbi:hypothetical protein D3C75_1042730 [compost metagenome]
MAIRCFWPPDSPIPRSPTTVSYPSGISIMKSWALASLAARIISSMSTFFRPYEILLRIEEENRNVSWNTVAICDRRLRTLYSRMSTPSSRMLPLLTS